MGMLVYSELFNTMSWRRLAPVEIEALEDEYLWVLLVVQEDAKVPWENIEKTRQRLAQAIDVIIDQPHNFIPFRNKCQKLMTDTEKDAILTLFWMKRYIAEMWDGIQRYW